MNDSFDQAERTLTKRKLRPPRRAKQIGDERKARARDVGEEERRAAGGDDATMDFGGFEERIDRSGDLDDVVVSPQPVYKLSQISKQNPGTS